MVERCDQTSCESWSGTESCVRILIQPSVEVGHLAPVAQWIEQMVKRAERAGSVRCGAAYNL
uniref:Uncharacterized protein n=1 Tax=Physcomitrium patens TaxID=3218 RepID=A0A2K1IAV4_PHYPA|nr:hypothetical protein PHYPA_030982 [Physcomitrium patens]